MADEEKTTSEGGAEASQGTGFEDISWEDAAADLEKQKEMLRADAETQKEETQPAKYEAPAAVSVAEKETRNIDLILDIPLQVSVELGKTKMLINDLLQLGQGSVVELEKLAGEPLDIYINGKQVARGEAVIVNEKFGVRLTDIISPEDRVDTLA